MNRLFFILAATLPLGLIPVAAAGADNFTTIDYPDAITTGAKAINDAGAIIGNYTAVGGVSHGYLLTGGKFTSVDFPEGKSSSVQAINSSGDIAGQWVDSGNKTHSYLLSQGKFIAVPDYPGADLSGVIAMNASGVMTGHIQMPGKPMQGFILRGGAWTVVDYRPDAPSNTMNCYFGINDAGAMAGHWGTRGTTHGVVYKDGKFTQLDYGGGGLGLRPLRVEVDLLVLRVTADHARAERGIGSRIRRAALDPEPQHCFLRRGRLRAVVRTVHQLEQTAR